MRTPNSFPAFLSARRLVKAFAGVALAGVALAGVALASALIPAPAAFADQNTVAVTIQTDDGWAFRPAMSGGSVVGLLASHDPATVPGHTFSNVWFERQPDGSFVASGSVAAPPAAVAQYLESVRGEALFANAELHDGDLVAAAAVNLVPMINGLAVDDIFQPIAAVLTPEQMEFIVEVGAHGAVSLSRMEAEVVQDNCNDLDHTEEGGHGSNLALFLDQTAEEVEASVTAWTGGSVAPPALLRACCFPHYNTVVLTAGFGCGGGTGRVGGDCTYPCASCTDVTMIWVTLIDCTTYLFSSATTTRTPCTWSRPQIAPGVCP